MDRASGELASTQPAKVANSDAKALARHLDAAGLHVTPGWLTDLLALLAVLMIGEWRRLVARNRNGLIRPARTRPRGFRARGWPDRTRRKP